jgi:hypothetical protein
MSTVWVHDQLTVWNLLLYVVAVDGGDHVVVLDESYISTEYQLVHNGKLT